MKRAVTVVLVFALVGGGLVLALNPQRSSDTLESASSQALPPVRAPEQLEVQGRIVPVRHTTLSFATSGIVAAVPVQEGDVVRTGQVLARLVSRQQEAALEQARAEVRRTEAQLAELQTGATREEVAVAEQRVMSAREALNRVRSGATEAEIAQAQAALTQAQAELVSESSRTPLRPEKLEAAKSSVAAAQAQLAQLRRGPSPAEIAQAEAALRLSQAQLEQLRAGPRAESAAALEAALAAAQADEKGARLALEETILRAPFSGTIAKLDLRPGQYVTPESADIWLADMTEWEVLITDVTELQVAKLAIGMPGRIKVDAIPGLEMEGEVTRIRPVGEKYLGEMVYRVVVSTSDHDERLRWNMTSTVTFDIDSQEGE